ncbi:MAG: metallophosphoesterase [Myxococcota bacterium]
MLFGPGASTAQVVTRGPYLQLGTATGVIVRWRTDLPTDSVVRYGTTLALGSAASQATPTTEHVVPLSGLPSATRHYYAVGNAVGNLAGGDASHSFLTAPIPGSDVPTRIWVIGDSGKANQDALDVRDAYQAWTGANGTDVWLMLGDNAYVDGTDLEFQAAVFDIYPEQLRHVPLWPTLGNHDTGASVADTETGPYFDIFSLPRAAEAGGVASGTEAYYSFDHANVHFVCLDSDDTDRSPSGDMFAWLEADLQATSQDWIIVYFHHSPYAKGGSDSDVEPHGSDMRTTFLPLLEAHGVDLVFSAHDHSYQRSFLVDGHYGLSTSFTAAMALDGGDGREGGDGAYQKPPGPVAHAGTVYVVNGTGSDSTSGPFDHPTTVLGLVSLGSVVIDVDGDRLDARFLDDAGVVADHWTLLKAPDETPPSLLAVEALGTTQVEATFSEPLEQTSAETVANYSVGFLDSVLAASLQADSRTVRLTTTRLAPGDYNLAVVDVEDRFGNGVPPFTLFPFSFSAEGSWQGRLTAGPDDAEQDVVGLDTDFGSGDLEMSFDALTQQLVGLRFRDVPIPAGATIGSAFLQFEADEADSGPTPLLVEGEAADDAAPFQELPDDLGARARTAAAVPWSPPAWLSKGDAGPAQRSPDLSPLLQEIVDRPGWVPGNALAILISGDGVRTAESVEGSPAGAPLLSVDWELALPACSDGIDNDDDFLTDFPSDPQCASDEDSTEAPLTPNSWGCGLGPELPVPLALLLAAHLWRRARTRAA